MGSPGRLSATIPLYRVGGRGDVGYDMVALIDTGWDVQKTFAPNGEITSIQPIVKITTPLQAGPVMLMSRPVLAINSTCPNGQPEIDGTQVRYQLQWNDGSSQSLRDANYDGQLRQNPYTCQLFPPESYDAGRGSTLLSRDGSMMRVILDSNIQDSLSNSPFEGPHSGTLYTSNGLRYRIENHLTKWIEDRNGNILSLAYDSNNIYLQSVT